MKKQIITVVAVALAALLLFAAYALFFKKSDIEEVGDEFYKLTPSVKESLSGIKDKTVFTLSGYDADDEGFAMISKFVDSVVLSNIKFKKDETESGEKGLEVSSSGKDKFIAYDDFFKSLKDGTRYAFDGENLIANAALEINGLDKKDIPLRALTGFDTDGDYVTSNGLPFIFKSIQRSEIAVLDIKNPLGDYTIYQENDGNFYFKDSLVASYDDEKFSMVTTNCRYPVAVGKMKLPENRKWEDYGLAADNPATATYTIMTTPDSNGNYFLHTVYIGGLSSEGTYFYSRYVGGKFKAAGGDLSEDELVENLTKDFIYYIDSETVVNSICLPETALMKPTIMNSITATEDLLKIDNVTIDYKDGVHAVVKNLSAFTPAPNLASNDNSSISKVILDKVSAKDYSSYQGGWLNNLAVFGGFTSSDGKSTYIRANLAKYADSGKYSVSFGLARDDSLGAKLPNSIKITASADGVNWITPDGNEIIPSQSDKTVKKYTFDFEYETEHIRYIKIAFDVPQVANSYVVFDEIRTYADGADAQPTDSVSGVWRLTMPSEHIPEGHNFSYLDMTNFNTFLQEFASLEGESVVDCGFSDKGDATKLDTEKLAKYGLDDPERHYSFDFQGITSNLYVSARNENGIRYAYTTFVGSYNGQSVNATTDVIVTFSTEKAAWLDWEFFEYLDHSLLSMYIVEVEDMEISFDGKTYKFDLTLDDEGALGDVSYGGKSYDVKSFKYLYQSILMITMQDKYTPAEDEKPEEYLRIKIHSETRSPEIVFYRVTSSKCYFTIDGEGSYYALANDINNVRKKTLAYVSGEIIESAS
ncbi:MAG: hypothetical protein KBS44_01710 [Clostridiales bacterium]|nr:hypothetical protein [Candidatus Coliplasma equi]